MHKKEFNRCESRLLSIISFILAVPFFVPVTVVGIAPGYVFFKQVRICLFWPETGDGVQFFYHKAYIGGSVMVLAITRQYKIIPDHDPFFCACIMVGIKEIRHKILQHSLDINFKQATNHPELAGNEQ